MFIKGLIAAIIFFLYLLISMTVIGWIIAIFGYFYIGVVASKMFGDVYLASSA